MFFPGAHKISETRFDFEKGVFYITDEDVIKSIASSSLADLADDLFDIAANKADHDLIVLPLQAVPN